MINFVWIEPVRDWNFLNDLKLVLLKIRLNRTCEGLKLTNKKNRIILVVKFESNLWGIETLLFFEFFLFAPRVWIEPVRDWNKNFYGYGIKYLLGLNRTCEGLKLKRFLRKSLNFFVWIEPVRDWNRFFTPMPKGATKFESNLWGIETWEIYGLFKFWFLFESNLWGIETMNFQLFVLKFYQFESNLWGIETKLILQYAPVKAYVWIEPVRDWNKLFTPMAPGFT